MRKSSFPENKKNQDNLIVFIEAAQACIEHKSFKKVTVQDIVDRAGLSRQTFYRCCNSKYDMIGRYLGHLIARTFEQSLKDRDMDSFPGLLLSRLAERKNLFASACSLNDYDSPDNSVRRIVFLLIRDHILTQNDAADTCRLVLLDAYCESASYLVRRWLLEEIDGQPLEIAGIILDLMPVKLKEAILI